MALGQKSPLTAVDKYTCSSYCLKSAIALITALEAMPATVKNGYLDLYQADSAPGQDPPTHIHGLFLIPQRWLYWTCQVKYAKSRKACSEFKYLKFAVQRDQFPKGIDLPQNRCSKTSTIPCILQAIVTTHCLPQGMPLQVYSPQIYKKTGPILGLKYLFIAQYRCLNVFGDIQQLK